jgi:hypothetical protein
LSHGFFLGKQGAIGKGFPVWGFPELAGMVLNGGSGEKTEVTEKGISNLKIQVSNHGMEWMVFSVTSDFPPFAAFRKNDGYHVMRKVDSGV